MSSPAALFGVTALAALLTATPASAQLPDRPFNLTKLADGVYALMWPTLVDPVEANVLIVINDEDVLLVDSSFMPSTAKRIVAEIRKLTPKPVRYVVNTHWHNDHVQGNQVYRETWPGVQFISQTRTRDDTLQYCYNTIPKDREQAAENVRKYQKWLADGKDDQDKPLDDKRRHRIEEVITLERQMIAETEHLTTTLADMTFDEAMTLHRGSRTIEIRYLGLGNTRGDAVVILPKERIVATGDLVVHPEPFGFGSYYKEWKDTLGKLSALDVDTFVPGHGPVMRDREYITTLQALLGDMTTAVDAAVAKGATLEETKKQVTLDAWKKKLAGDNPDIARTFDAFFVTPAVERAWRQAKGEPGAREQGG